MHKDYVEDVISPFTRGTLGSSSCPSWRRATRRRSSTGSDLGFIPVVVTDARGAGNAQATQRSFEGMAFTGDAIMTNIATITGLLGTSKGE